MIVSQMANAFEARRVSRGVLSFDGLCIGGAICDGMMWVKICWKLDLQSNLNLMIASQIELTSLRDG
jgi:hypothetical protein